jgi:hypothetical protein
MVTLKIRSTSLPPFTFEVPDMSRYSLTAWMCAGCVCFWVAGCGGGDAAPDAQVASNDTVDESMESYEQSMEGSADASSATMTVDGGAAPPPVTAPGVMAPGTGTPGTGTPVQGAVDTGISPMGEESPAYMDPGAMDTGGGSHDSSYMEEGYEEGYEEGHEEGHEERHSEEGYEEGYEEGSEEGYMRDGHPGGLGAGQSVPQDPAGSYDPGGASGGRGTAKPLTYADHAQQAFQQGDDSQAIRYLMAHAVTADAEQAKSLLDQMGFNSHVRRPAFAVRWGVGIEFTPPRGYAGSIFPIGTQQNIGGKPGRAAVGPGAMGAAGGMEGSEMGEPGHAGAAAGGNVPLPQPVRLLTGELGETIVEQFMVRLKRGDYGQVLQTSGAPTQGTTSGYGSGYEQHDGEYGSEGGQMPGGMGMGMNLGGGMGGGSGAGARMGGAQGPRSVLPGVTLIAIGSNSKELVAKAKEAGVDVLCVFRISIKLNPRVNLVTNETSLAIFDVGSGKEVFSTRPLNNISVQRERAEGEPDGVETTLRALFEHVDQNWQLGPLPQMNTERVLTRLRALIKQPSGDDPLAALTEARLYHSRGLVQDDHLTVAYQQLLGDEQTATTLLTGTEEEKRAIVDDWVRTPTAARSSTGPRDILQGSEP